MIGYTFSLNSVKQRKNHVSCRAYLKLVVLMAGSLRLHWLPDCLAYSLIGWLFEWLVCWLVSRASLD
jgi:hypothetical protein